MSIERYQFGCDSHGYVLEKVIWNAEDQKFWKDQETGTFAISKTF